MTQEIQQITEKDIQEGEELDFRETNKED